MPGLHGVCVTDPVEQDDPVGHSMQSSALVITDGAAYRPEGHGSPMAAPSEQYSSNGQLVGVGVADSQKNPVAEKGANA